MTTDPAKAIENLQISKTKELKGTEKRDTLIAIEKKYQKKWTDDKIFEVDSPSLEEYPLESISAAELRAKHPKLYAPPCIVCMRRQQTSPSAGCLGNVGLNGI